jgi:uncharacterized protein (TIGR02186 family)
MSVVRACLAAAALLAGTAGAEAETLVTALSTNEVRIASNFTGDQVTVFGAIGRDAATISRASGYDLVVVMRGPPEAVVVWRKERLLGIWVNRASRTFTPVPSFYALEANRPLTEIAADPVLRRLGLGPTFFLDAADKGSSAASLRPFHQALIRLNGENGRFSQDDRGVELLGEGIFRTTIQLPANVPVGIYSVEVYLFSDSGLLARAEQGLTISKIGFEQFLSGFARDQALIFGVGCVAIAMAIGWLAGVIFRRD